MTQPPLHEGQRIIWFPGAKWVPKPPEYGVVVYQAGQKVRIRLDSGRLTLVPRDRVDPAEVHE